MKRRQPFHLFRPLSVFCPSSLPSSRSPSVSFVCFWVVSSDKTLCLIGPNLQFRRGTCGLFMCLTCHCFCKAWRVLTEGVSVVCVSVWTYLLDWAGVWAQFSTLEGNGDAHRRKDERCKGWLVNEERSDVKSGVTHVLRRFQQRSFSVRGSREWWEIPRAMR